jgi:undecaprenyl-phosphate galactose phosphotransferase
MNESVLLNGNDLVKEKSKNKNYYYTIKRVFDILFSIYGLFILSILIIIVKLAYMLTGDFKPVLFTQKRIGKNGEFFKFYKFRTMCDNADEVLEELLKNDPKAKEEYDLNKKLKNDPRITKVGRVIRKLSIDETPQFINILKGDMHLIGNRPYLPREIEDMGSYYKDIVKTKPGLTGYWQVNGRSNTTFKRRLQLEKEYSNKANLWLDTKIFFKSLPTIILCRGAE